MIKFQFVIFCYCYDVVGHIYLSTFYPIITAFCDLYQTRIKFLIMLFCSLMPFNSWQKITLSVAAATMSWVAYFLHFILQLYNLLRDNQTVQTEENVHFSNRKKLLLIVLSFCFNAADSTGDDTIATKLNCKFIKHHIRDFCALADVSMPIPLNQALKNNLILCLETRRTACIHRLFFSNFKSNISADVFEIMLERKEGIELNLQLVERKRFKHSMQTNLYKIIVGQSQAGVEIRAGRTAVIRKCVPEFGWALHSEE